MSRVFWWILLGFVLAAALPPPGWADDLVGLGWTSAEDLRSIASVADRVRFVTRGKVLAELSPRGLAALRAAGREPFLVDKPDGSGAYYLVPAFVAPPPGGISPVYVDSAGWMLFYLRPEQAAVAWPHFLYELPREYSLRGWLPPTVRAKPAIRLSAASVDELLRQVDPKRLRRDVLTLSLLNPDGTSAYDNLRSRFVVNPQIREATEYIRSQLAAALGEDAVRLEEFQVSSGRLTGHLRGRLGQGDVDLRAYNIVGELPGTDPEAGYYVICGHYDATAVRSPHWNWRTDPAPGADDNGTGAALVMEAARVLAARRFPWSIRFIAFSGEELGLLGSRAYASAVAQEGDRILGVLNFDMFGYNDLVDRVQLATNPASHWLTDLMVASNARYHLGLQLDVLVDDKAVLSDHSSFWARGYDAILAIENYLPTDSTHYAVRQGLYRVNTANHSTADVPDSLNWTLVYKTTRLAVATLGQYAQPQGKPDLAVFTGDLRQGDDGGLRLQVSNLGTGAVRNPFALTVKLCGADSNNCREIFRTEYAAGVSPGGVGAVTVPWDRLGQAVFRMDVDPDHRIGETEEANNRAFQRLYVQPRSRIVVYPNPFRPGRDPRLVFTGLPWNARVRIFSPTGKLVWQAQEDGSRQRHLNPAPKEVWWLGVTSGAGDDRSAPLVASGVYVYTVSTEAGQLLARSKIAVIR